MSESCGECRFWQREYRESEDGFCRRYAPRPFRGHPTGPFWPTTADVQWCGEFEPRAVDATSPHTVDADLGPVLWEEHETHAVLDTSEARLVHIARSPTAAADFITGLNVVGPLYGRYVIARLQGWKGSPLK